MMITRYHINRFWSGADRKSSFLVWDKEPEEVAKNPQQPRSLWESRSPWYNAYHYDQELYKSMDVKWVTEPKEEFLDRDAFMAFAIISCVLLRSSQRRKGALCLWKCRMVTQYIKMKKRRCGSVAFTQFNNMECHTLVRRIENVCLYNLQAVTQFKNVI